MSETTRELAAGKGIDIDAEYSMSKHKSLRGRINSDMSWTISPDRMGMF